LHGWFLAFALGELTAGVCRSKLVEALAGRLALRSHPANIHFQDSSHRPQPLKSLDGLPVFEQEWQAQILAMVDALIINKSIESASWFETFGAELTRARAAGRPDDLGTYYAVALDTLEKLVIGVHIFNLSGRFRVIRFTEFFVSTIICLYVAILGPTEPNSYLCK